PDTVRQYLQESLGTGLIEELAVYYHLLNPDLYSGRKRKIAGDDKTRARARIDQYRSSFAGWSMYTVAGVFFGENTQMPPTLRPTQRLEAVEELVQVLRLIFRFSRRNLDQEDDPLLTAALAAECDDVYRIIVFRIINRLERVVGLNPWTTSERDRFLSQHRRWKTPSLQHKYDFAKQYFSDIAREAEHWLDDCSLFVFGFLVRQFAQKVLLQREERQEAEIWVTHFLDLNVNVTTRPPRVP
ncbi:MAG: hypothetical protein ACREQV_04205, partial [Candidatus Binatia bacterium]